MLALHQRIDWLNETIGRAIAWLILLMVLLQFTIVILRYVFAIGFIPMQESVWYLHAFVFMLGAGYTLLHDAHVRVDVVYRHLPIKGKALIDLVGVLIFLLPLCGMLWWLSWGYVASSWRVLEGSGEMAGLPFIYLLKSVLLVFALLLALQGVSLAIRSLLILAEAAADEGVADSYEHDGP
jgi:TRAP-type mannitol/chloroaromatic compound transport system permease small subunit